MNSGPHATTFLNCERLFHTENKIVKPIRLSAPFLLATSIKFKSTLLASVTKRLVSKSFRDTLKQARESRQTLSMNRNKSRAGPAHFVGQLLLMV